MADGQLGINFNSGTDQLDRLAVGGIVNRRLNRTVFDQGVLIDRHNRIVFIRTAVSGSIAHISAPVIQ